MDYDLVNQTNERWIKAGRLLLDVSSMENGFLKMKGYRQEVWDYIQCRESLLKWPPVNEEGKKISSKGESG